MTQDGPPNHAADPNFWIRHASEEDLPAIETLSDVVQSMHAVAHPDVFRPRADPSGRQSFFQSAIEDDAWQLWIAGRGGQTLAYAMAEVFHKHPGPIRNGFSEGHIHQICVAQKARRSGLASGLLRHILTAFETQNLDRTTVAYWAFNTESEAFFRTMGFTPVMITAELHKK